MRAQYIGGTTNFFILNPVAVMLTMQMIIKFGIPLDPLTLPMITIINITVNFALAESLAIFLST